jgi:hypothetical protein
MIRSITSVVAALAVIAVLVGGACASCWASPQKGMPAGHCCNQSGQCEKPGKAPVHKECASPAVDLMTVEQSNSHPVKIAPALIAIPAAAVIDYQQSTSRETTPQRTDPYSPPDLYLLNSVLTV